MPNMRRGPLPTRGPAGELLLHTKGRKSGADRVNPMMYLDEGDGRILVFASKGGHPTNPHWYHN